jgi:putative flavoprotein involved in K+ transport
MLDTSTTKTVNKVLDKLNKALGKNDAKAVAKCFESDGYWRDLASFTWNIKTLEGAPAIQEMVKAQQGQIKGGKFKITHNEAPADFNRRGLILIPILGAATAIFASATVKSGRC